MQTLIEEKKQRNALEEQAIGYIIISLVTSEEFSVRDYAGHYIKLVMIDQNSNSHLNILLEQTIVRSLYRPMDEMILKT